MKRTNRCVVIALSALLGACNGSDPDAAQYGADPTLPDQQRGLLPDMTSAKPAQRVIYFFIARNYFSRI